MSGEDDEEGWSYREKAIKRMRGRIIRRLASETLHGWISHSVPRLGAALAFYTLLSLAPLLVIVVGVASLAFGQQAAEGNLVLQIRDQVGQSAAEVVQSILRAAYRKGAGSFATGLSFAALLYGASAVGQELRTSLNIIWDAEQKRRSAWRTVVHSFQERAIALATVVGIGILLIGSVVAGTILASLGGRLSELVSIPPWLVRAVDALVTYAVITTIFATLYKVLPDRRLQWRDVIVGAAATSLLFCAGRIVLSSYLGRAIVSSPYGAAGSVVVLMLWIYYSAQIFFLGAEFTHAWAKQYGFKPASMTTSRTPRDVAEL